MEKGTFKALVVSETEDKEYIRRIQDKTIDDLPEGDVLVARRPVYSGKAFATVTTAGKTPQVISLRPNVFALETPDPSKSPEVVKGSADTASRAKVTATETTAQHCAAQRAQRAAQRQADSSSDNPRGSAPVPTENPREGQN